MARALLIGIGVFVVGVAALLVGGSWYWNYSRTHRGSTDVGEHAVEKATGYTEAPVLWVGPEYDVDGDGEPEPLSAFVEFANDELYIGYGQCDFPDYEGGCALPLSITINFSCNEPEHPTEETIRGVPTSHLSHLRLHSDDAIITIFTTESRERDVALALHGANALASHISRDSDLNDLGREACRG